MDDYISRADAIEAVGYEIDDGYNAIVDRIKALPSANAVQGEWILHDGYYCSNCHYKLQTTGIPQYCCEVAAYINEDGYGFCSCGERREPDECE